MIIPIVLRKNKDNEGNWEQRTYTPDQVEEKIIQNIYNAFANELVHESGLKVDCIRMPDGKVKVQIRKGNRACTTRTATRFTRATSWSLPKRKFPKKSARSVYT